MLSKVYLIIGTGLILFCGFMALSGKELGGGKRDKIPPDMRSRDGYRSFHIFHGGYRGGK